MRGYIIVDRRNKEGSIFVPEVDLQFKACPGGKRGWLDVYFTDGMHYEHKGALATKHAGEPKTKQTVVQWLKANFDFAKEIDVPPLMIRFAIEVEEKKRKQVVAFGDLFESMVKGKPTSLDRGGEQGFKAMERAVHRARDIMASKEVGELSDAKKHAMALQIQRWIHEAGGLC
ncbi:MAG: hypothetical protein HYS26_01730 [Candidatus Kaiserbacteria bacterium]|nr:MAG: hypothetical protein HYS26_01730 [Candidatus Kaiserbacteria bacterium]